MSWWTSSEAARWPACWPCCARAAPCAIAGAIDHPVVDIDLRTLYLKDLRLLGCTFQDDEVFENLVGYIERNEFRPAVAQTYPLSAIAAAQRDFLTKEHVGKLVLIPPPVGGAP